jgi:hypothetical protein
VSTYPSEDDRAALWQQQTRDRVQFQMYLWTTVLAAPPGPRQAIIDGWAPVILAQLEDQAGPIDPEDDP